MVVEIDCSSNVVVVEMVWTSGSVFGASAVSFFAKAVIVCLTHGFLLCLCPQIFYDLVRQINRKTPVPGKARKKSNCQLL